MFREQGEDFTEAYVELWLLELNSIMNLKNKMSEVQTRLTAKEIVNEFYNLKIADLTLIFRNIMSGKYGEFYERLDMPKILTMFREYNEERMQTASQRNTRKHYETKVKR